SPPAAAGTAGTASAPAWTREYAFASCCATTPAECCTGRSSPKRVCRRASPWKNWRACSMRPDDPIRLARCLAAHWRGLEDGKSTVHLQRYVIVAACFMVACCARIEHPPTATAADAPTQPAARPLPPPPV